MADEEEGGHAGPEVNNDARLKAVFTGVKGPAEGNAVDQVQSGIEGLEGALKVRMLQLLSDMRQDHEYSVQEERDKYGERMADLDSQTHIQTTALRRNRDENAELRKQSAKLRQKVNVLEATLAGLQKKYRTSLNEKAELQLSVEQAHKGLAKAEMDNARLTTLLETIGDKMEDQMSRSAGSRGSQRGLLSRGSDNGSQRALRSAGSDGSSRPSGRRSSRRSLRGTPDKRLSMDSPSKSGRRPHTPNDDFGQEGESAVFDQVTPLDDDPGGAAASPSMVKGVMASPSARVMPMGAWPEDGGGDGSTPHALIKTLTQDMSTVLGVLEGIDGRISNLESSKGGGRKKGRPDAGSGRRHEKKTKEKGKCCIVQ